MTPAQEVVTYTAAVCVFVMAGAWGWWGSAAITRIAGLIAIGLVALTFVPLVAAAQKV